MMFYTHAAFACLCSLLVANYFSENKLQFVIIAVAATIFVDIDQVTSWIGRKLEPISITIHFLFKHRGFFHSITAALIISAFIYFINKEAAYAVFTGYASHIFLDAFNKSGVRLFSPFSKYKIKGFMKTGGMIEHVLLLLLVSGIIYVIF